MFIGVVLSIDVCAQILGEISLCLGDSAGTALCYVCILLYDHMMYCTLLIDI